MKLQTAVLCNAATQEQTGLVNVLGAFISNMGGPALPIRGQLWVVARLEIEEHDYDEQHVLAIVVARDDDGEQIARVDAGWMSERPAPDAFDPDLPIATNIVAPLPLEFRREGLHTVSIIANGDPLWSTRLKIQSHLQAL